VKLAVIDVVCSCCLSRFSTNRTFLLTLSHYTFKLFLPSKILLNSIKKSSKFSSLRETNLLYHRSTLERMCSISHTSLYPRGEVPRARRGVFESRCWSEFGRFCEGQQREEWRVEEGETRWRWRRLEQEEQEELNRSCLSAVGFVVRVVRRARSFRQKACQLPIQVTRSDFSDSSSLQLVGLLSVQPVEKQKLIKLKNKLNRKLVSHESTT